jgi:hypothetical protein
MNYGYKHSIRKIAETVGYYRVVAPAFAGRQALELFVYLDGKSPIIGNFAYCHTL